MKKQLTSAFLSISMVCSALSLPAFANDSSTETEEKVEETGEADAHEVTEQEKAKENWTWMGVSGWSLVGLGVMSMASGGVIYANREDPGRERWGLGLAIGGAAAALIGGAVVITSPDGSDDNGEVVSSASALGLTGIQVLR